MALAPGHLLGQIIGNVLEAAMKPVLQELADRHHLYLDSAGPRPSVRPGHKLTWRDDFGNDHDLDFVLERGGTYYKQGVPAAFVETAWRRYTKHSKAKAQEVQGAVLPLVAAYANVKPAPAAVVAGEWTRPALAQLVSTGFTTEHLHFPTMARVFAAHGMDIVGQGEGTPDDFWQAQCDVYLEMTDAERAALAQELRDAHRDEFEAFSRALEERIIRTIEQVTLLPLHGSAMRFGTIEEAIEAVNHYPGAEQTRPLVRFEVRVRYTNGDEIVATFGASHDAVEFLESFL